jgi:hypothetical protein
MYAGVVSPQAVLNFVEQIPWLRSSTHFPVFTQPISVQLPVTVQPLTNLTQPQHAHF